MMSSKRQEVTLMNNFAETAADILLSTLTAVKTCPITGKLIIVPRFCHTCSTAGESVRPTLGMGVGLFFICWLFNLSMHNGLLKHCVIYNPIVICWLINLNMHNEPVKYDIKWHRAWHKICFHVISNVCDVYFNPNIYITFTLYSFKTKKQVQQTSLLSRRNGFSF